MAQSLFVAACSLLAAAGATGSPAATDGGKAASVATAATTGSGTAPAPNVPHGPYGLGTPVTPRQVSGWNIDVAPDGKNLPPGSGTLAQGQQLYTAQCVSCHGAKGEGGVGDRLAGGFGTLKDRKPIRTVGSYWPYATTLFDYIRRAMPLTAPQSLGDDEVYAVTAYVLSLNGLWPDGQPANAQTLLKVRMPNVDGFVPDPRPDVP
ncbi:c-type cytochrome [Achromobacter aloeverae]|uniref:c-type cytochrome n=1 Tax=Achromobacter aloeverae TaxID=1750518 RepID=UPI001F0110CA|nr:cytochrome c [Achromobacter aloeverae]